MAEVYSNCPVSGESPREELFNFWTHILGFFLSLAGASVLLWTSISMDFWFIVSCFTYSITLIVLYGVSSFYHRCTRIERKKVLKIIDHISIYLFIAGSYTPFTLGPLREINGWLLFFVVWGIALSGVAFKIFIAWIAGKNVHVIERFNLVSLFSYLVMGWIVLFNLPILLTTLTPAGLFWLIAGGLAYTCGTIFYVWESLPYSHGIWHLFVLSGSACHYCSIFHLAL